MSPLLSVENLTVDLQVSGTPRTVLRDVSFSVQEGQTVGLVGESGSGKSMTVRAVSRLLPDGARVSGRIRFADQEVLDLRGSALRRYRASDVAMIFQDPRAYTNPLRRIGDFLTESMVINDRVPRRRAERTAAGLLEEVGIPDPERRMRQYPHELSGGLLQRVMIAAAVAARPRLVLADEPTTALDVTTQAEVMRILIRMQREYGMAMMLITHDLDLAASVCDETIVLYAGEVVETQPTRSLHDDPLHPYTAALMQARPEIHQRAERLLAIPGSPTTAYEAPPGCSFAPRCRFAQDVCRTETPPIVPVGAGASRCLFAEELRGTLLDPLAPDAPEHLLPATAEVE
ncbi:MAG TPA: ABC transporter ATP-binding protein [Nocardioides sp.]|uniref:ABC transporter ATP-binding protein n=1 Tax=Nocardioides sp. TaxID=35761 RepID=UPI002ED9761D